MHQSDQERLSDTVRRVLGYRLETQAGLAAALGMDRKTVSKRLANRVPWTVEDLGNMAKHFGCRREDLLYGPTEAVRRLTGAQERV